MSTTVQPRCAASPSALSSLLTFDCRSQQFHYRLRRCMPAKTDASDTAASARRSGAAAMHHRDRGSCLRASRTGRLVSI
jgi:hypothetical protein